MLKRWLLIGILVNNAVVFDSHAITDDAASTMTVVAGVIGTWLGQAWTRPQTYAKNNYPNKLIGAAIGGAVAISVSYVICCDRIPQARLSAATKIAHHVNTHQLMVVPHTDADAYINLVQYQYIREEYPLLAAVQDLSALEDEIISASNALKAALSDLQGDFKNRGLHQQISEYYTFINSLQVKVRARLYTLKMGDGQYSAQKQRAQQAQLAKEQLALLQQSVNAATEQAAAARANAAAQQLKAQAATVNSITNLAQAITQNSRD